jgi:hypothetical protein
MTVPARPQSTVAPPTSSPGVTTRSGPKGSPDSTSSIVVPRARSASIIKEVSRECRGARSVEGESARAESTSSRFVSDFDPGSDKEARSGPAAPGATQRPSSTSGGTPPSS